MVIPVRAHSYPPEESTKRFSKQPPRLAECSSLDRFLSRSPAQTNADKRRRGDHRCGQPSNPHKSAKQCSSEATNASCASWLSRPSATAGVPAHPVRGYCSQGEMRPLPRTRHSPAHGLDRADECGSHGPKVRAKDCRGGRRAERSAAGFSGHARATSWRRTGNRSRPSPASALGRPALATDRSCPE